VRAASRRPARRAAPPPGRPGRTGTTRPAGRPARAAAGCPRPGPGPSPTSMRSRVRSGRAGGSGRSARRSDRPRRPRRVQPRQPPTARMLSSSPPSPSRSGYVHFSVHRYPGRGADRFHVVTDWTRRAGGLRLRHRPPAASAPADTPLRRDLWVGTRVTGDGLQIMTLRSVRGGGGGRIVTLRPKQLPFGAGSVSGRACRPRLPASADVDRHVGDGRSRRSATRAGRMRHHGSRAWSGECRTYPSAVDVGIRLRVDTRRSHGGGLVPGSSGESQSAIGLTRRVPAPTAADGPVPCRTRSTEGRRRGGGAHGEVGGIAPMRRRLFGRTAR
jgi:hypothetical protein